MKNEIIPLWWRQPLLALVMASVASLVFHGCCTSKESQVQQAAKDWCMTIRGSQVIPVYPLTEDIQPGDVFLVQVPVDRQQEIYRQRGFLPMDNHLARLNPSGYDRFYANSFLANRAGITNVLPRDWMRPHGVGLYFGTNGSNTHSWLSAPRAAFPSYGFTVKRGAGVNLAVPVQGVPVGLSLLASDAASGSIQIQDARTLGVDMFSLYEDVRCWATTNAGFLRHFGVGLDDGRENYLRVVTRVYASGRMVVTLKDASNQSAGLDTGVPKPVNLLVPEPPSGLTNTQEAALRNYTNAWNAIATMVAAAATTKDAAGNVLPGGSLRLAAASSRSVTLDETFDPPVILGYLGFDCAILPGGVLGPPIPTHAVIDPTYHLEDLLKRSPVYGAMLDILLYKIISERTGDPQAAEVQRQLDSLAILVPPVYESFSWSPGNRTLNVTEIRKPVGGTPAFTTYEQYRTKLESSIRAINHALQARSFSLIKGTNAAIPVAKESDKHQELDATVEYFRRLERLNAEDAAVKEAEAALQRFYLEHLLK